MGKEIRPSLPPASDRRKWDRIFRALVELLRSQQSQIETLANERRVLETYVHDQHELWTSRSRFLESQIAQMKREEVRRHRVEAAWLDLVAGLKQREALCYKKQLELSESDLEDFRECIEALGPQILELKGKHERREGNEVDKGRRGSTDEKSVQNAKEGDQSIAALKLEIKKLKHAYKKVSSQKETEVSALLAEKDFVWNQFKKMENDYTGILKTKKMEVDQANEAIEKLQANIEELQSSNSEKDKAIAKLAAETARLALDVRRHDEEAQQAKEQAEELHLKMKDMETTAKLKDEMIDGLKSSLTKLEMDVKRYAAENFKLSMDLESRRSSKIALSTPQGSHLKIASGKRKRGTASSHASQKHRNANDGNSRSRPSTVSSDSIALSTPQGSHLKIASGKRKRGTAISHASQKHRNANDGNSRSRPSTVSSRFQRCSNREELKIISRQESPKLFSAKFKVPKLKISSPAAVP